MADIRKNLIKKITSDLRSSGFSLTEREVNSVFNIVIDNIRFAIVSGLHVPIKNLGEFTTKLVKRKNMSQGEGEFIFVWTVFFKAATSLKKDVKEHGKS